MLYLNQKKYPDIPYRHNTDHGGAAPEHSHISAAGCGLCCMSMIVENLTMEELPLLVCRDLSEQIGANHSVGTDLNILGKEVAERFHLTFETTDDIEQMINHLRKGGMAVANAGGDREGYIGLLSHGGHYVVVTGYDEESFAILDPSYTADKYLEEGRIGRLKDCFPFLYIDCAVLKKECENRHPSYYLFARRKETE